MWQQWVNVIVGLFVIAVPFTGMAAATMMWTLIVSGVVIVGLSLWSAYEISAEREEGTAMRHAHS
jgi:Sec-independent protein secretion pathway component TatC